MLEMVIYNDYVSQEMNLANAKANEQYAKKNEAQAQANVRTMLGHRPN